MNARSLTILFVLAALILGACSPQVVTQVVQQTVVVQQTQVVRQTAIAQQPRPTNPQPQAYPTAAPQVVYPTAAPAWGYPTPTQALDQTFTDYGVNAPVDTNRDHLSTFGLDVDTASYTLMRSAVQGGSLPPADSVRVEEYVNFFNPGYPTPSDVAFAIYADGAPSPFKQEGTYLLRFGVQGYRVSQADRRPVSLTLVIDVSGSMSEGDKMELIKQSLHLLVDQLQPGDTVAMVAYSTDAWVVLGATPVENHGAISGAIDGLYPHETTNVQAGLELGYQLALKYFRPETANRLSLWSDGVANEGLTDPNGLLDEVHGYVAQGIPLSTYGVGMGEYNDILLEQLADHGNGSYAYIDTVDQARTLFVENPTGSLDTIAINAKIQIDFNPDVVATYRLIGYENRAIADQNFRNDNVSAGAIGPGHHATAIYAVTFRPGAQGRIATAQLRWEDPQTHAIQEINGNLNSWDLAGSFEAAAPRFQLLATVAEYAELLRQSPFAGHVSLCQMGERARRLVQQLSEDADVIEFANLVSQAAMLAGSYE